MNLIFEVAYVISTLSSNEVRIRINVIGNLANNSLAFSYRPSMYYLVYVQDLNDVYRPLEAPIGLQQDFFQFDSSGF